MESLSSRLKCREGERRPLPGEEGFLFRTRSGTRATWKHAARGSVIVGLLLVIGCGTADRRGEPQALPTTADTDHLARAEQSFRAGMIVEAQLIYESLTGPAHATTVRGEATLGLGRIALRSGENHQALRHLSDARSLLRRSPLWATAELLYGEAHIRAGHLQSGIDALDNAFSYLVAKTDQQRAAYLITRTREILGQSAPERLTALARSAHFPEYDSVFAKYTVKEAPPPIPVIVKSPNPSPSSTGPARVIARKEWKARPTLKNVVRNRGLTKLTIHHTADQGNMVDLGSDDTAVYLRRLQEYFQKTKGYADLPYHYLIAKDGQCYEGRPLVYQGAHAGDNAANRENIGIALIGNFESKSPTREQLRSLRSVVDSLAKKHKISRAKIYPHCDLKETACPGAVLEGLVRSLYGNAPLEAEGASRAHAHAHSDTDKSNAREAARAE